MLTSKEATVIVDGARNRVWHGVLRQSLGDAPNPDLEGQGGFPEEIFCEMRSNMEHDRGGENDFEPLASPDGRGKTQALYREPKAGKEVSGSGPALPVLLQGLCQSQGPLFANASTTSSPKCPRTGRGLTF